MNPQKDKKTSSLLARFSTIPKFSVATKVKIFSDMYGDE